MYEVNSEGNDRVLYYINGDLYGSTYYGHDSYIQGCEIWNTDDCPFFIGVCPWGGDNNLYYLRGSVYTTRLYERPLDEDVKKEVSDNYRTTKAYRKVIQKTPE